VPDEPQRIDLESAEKAAIATPELEGQVAVTDSHVTVPGLPIISLGARYMIGAAFAFSIMSLLVKYAGHRLPSQEMVLARALFSLVVTWAVLRRERIPIWGNNRRLLWARGFIGFSGLAAFYYALVHIPLAEATVLQYSNPIFVAILAIWLLGERLRRREIAFVALAILGVLFIAKPTFIFGGGEALPLLAVLIGLWGAIGSGTAYVLVRKLSATEHVMVIVFYFSLASVLGSLPMAIPGAVMPTLLEWLVLLGIGITTQAAQVFLTTGLKYERAGRATAAAYTQIVFAAIWGIIFFHEVPDLLTVIGAGLIVIATIALSSSSAT
jgi:drug/metabolite transporter (DMT)-like permease